jgi:hypothetical protein
MTDIPKDFADALKENGLDEFFFELHRHAPAGISEVDYRGKTARDTKAKNTESAENAFR